MRSLIAAAILAAAALVAAPSPAAADEIRVALPDTLEFVEIQPGLQVVSRLDLEVFYSDGAYWLRSDGRWYSARRPSSGFAVAEARTVPPALGKLVPGRYLEYAPAAGQKVVQRHLDAEAPEPVGGEVNAGPAKLAPRGTLMPPDQAAPARPEAKPEVRPDPTPTPPAKVAPARAAPAKAATKKPVKPAPARKKPPAKPATKPLPRK